VHMYLKKYPVKAISRSGNRTIFTNEAALMNHRYMLLQNGLSRGFDFKVNYDIEKETATISSIDNGTAVTLYGIINNGDIRGIYLDDEYHFLPVRGKTVVDIGANIGDSSIYFALRGANKVIAIEPFPVSYEAATKNLEFNNLSEQIILLQAGCAADLGSITIDKDFGSDKDSSLQEFQNGIRIPLLTLEYILNEFAVPSNSILKMDCEGCEYEVMLSSSPDTLRKFSHMQIEYHYGHKSIKTKLESSGFKVSYDGPKYWKHAYFGYIYASRI
nr:FkbM family methyltransferase [Thermoproteota archaeon]